MTKGAGKNSREVRRDGGLPPEDDQEAPGIKEDNGGGSRFSDDHLSQLATKETGKEGGGAGEVQG